MPELYSRNDLVDVAYFVKDETLAIRLGDGPPIVYQAKNIIIGALEHFLKDFSPRNKRRLFTVSLRQTDKLKLIPFSVVDRMMNRFRFGFDTNIFAAYLLHASNQYYLERAAEVPRELAQYRERARRFTQLVDETRAFAAEHGFTELEELARDWQEESYYFDGVVFSRAVSLHAIATPSKPLGEFISRYPKNAIICSEGTNAESMFILLRGKVAVMTRNSVAASISTQGEAFGEVAWFLDGKRTATLIAEEDTDVYEIKRKNLKQFFAAHPNLFKNIAATLARRIHDNIERITHAEAKIAELKQFGTDTGAKRKFLEAKSQTELARFCEAVGRIQRAYNHRALDAFIIEKNILGLLLARD